MEEWKIPRVGVRLEGFQRTQAESRQHKLSAAPHPHSCGQCQCL